MRAALVTLALIVSPNCGNTPEPTPPVPIRETGIATCQGATANLERLGCVDANDAAYAGPNLHGEAFVTTCLAAQDEGVWLPLTCWQTARDCDEVKACR